MCSYAEYVNSKGGIMWLSDREASNAYIRLRREKGDLKAFIKEWESYDEEGRSFEVMRDEVRKKKLEKCVAKKECVMDSGKRQASEEAVTKEVPDTKVVVNSDVETKIISSLDEDRIKARRVSLEHKRKKAEVKAWMEAECKAVIAGHTPNPFVDEERKRRDEVKSLSHAKPYTNDSFKMGGMMIPKYDGMVNERAWKSYSDCIMMGLICVPIEIGAKTLEKGYKRVDRKGRDVPIKSVVFPKGTKNSKVTIPWYSKANGFVAMTGSTTNKDIDLGVIVALDLDDWHKDIDLEGNETITKSGHKFLNAYLNKHNIILPLTYTDSSGNGKGQHVLMKVPSNVHIGCRNGITFRGETYGLDVKGEGGQIIMAGSYNPGTDRYYETINNVPIADCPKELLSLLIHWRVDDDMNVIESKALNKAMGIREDKRDYSPMSNDDMKALLWQAEDDAFGDRQAWSDMGLALKLNGFSFDLFHEWSKDKAGGKYKGRDDCWKKWLKFEPKPKFAPNIGYIVNRVKESLPMGTELNITAMEQPERKALSTLDVMRRPWKLARNDLESMKEAKTRVKQLMSNIYRYIGGKGCTYLFYTIDETSDVPFFETSNQAGMREKFAGMTYKCPLKDQPGLVTSKSLWQPKYTTLVDLVICEPGKPVLFKSNDKVILNICIEKAHDKESVRRLCTDKTLEKKAHDWMDWHMRNVICNKCDKKFNWLYNLLGNQFFETGFQAGCCAVISGDQGCGKSEPFVKMFKNYAGAAFGYKDDSKFAGLGDLLPIRGKTYMISDETLVTTAQDLNKLKTLITAPFITLAVKYENPITVRNFLNVIILSNNGIPIEHNDMNDRRFVEFRCNTNDLPGLKFNDPSNARYHYYDPLYDIPWYYFVSYFFNYDSKFIFKGFKSDDNVITAEIKLPLINQWIRAEVIPELSSIGVEHDKLGRVVSSAKMYSDYKTWLTKQTDGKKAPPSAASFAKIIHDLGVIKEVKATRLTIKVQDGDGYKSVREMCYTLNDYVTIKRLWVEHSGMAQLLDYDECICGSGKAHVKCGTHNINLCNACADQHDGCNLDDL